MKRILLGVSLLCALTLATGCGSKETLTCSKTVQSNGMTTVTEEKYTFENDRISNKTTNITLTIENDDTQSLEEYKKTSQNTIEAYKVVDGIDAKMDVQNNKITQEIKFTPSSMSEDNIASNGLGENYDSTIAIKTEEGYTCK